MQKKRTESPAIRLITCTPYLPTMGNSQQAYTELLELRTRLREENASPTGKEPKICSDESLMDMAVRLPARKNDLLLIKGIGETFADKYGEQFLEITRKYIRDTAKSVPLTGKSASILNDLEKKLVNIGKGNNLLYCPRLSKSRSFDLLQSSMDDPMRLIFGQRREYTLCNTTKSRADAKIYSRLTQISREAVREYREKGFMDLYIAYPFVIGRLTDDLPIRAPLVLFPVLLSKTQNTVNVKYDESRDALYNTTLLLANMKVNGVRRDMPDPSIENVDRELFIQNTLSFFRDSGLEIEDDGGYVTPFEEYGAETFPDYRPGELHIDNSIVLGKFPLYSNSIQKDFNDLTFKDEINKALNDILLSPADMSQEERNEPLSSKDFMERGMSVSEKEIDYINPVNSAQEQVMAALEWMDELVVQGPPGTGKSQVITSLITDAVNKGKTVLMVSEKKTALDVVYSRLGHLSKYVMMVDDVTNKDLFYDQLKRMMELPPNKTEKAEDTTPLSDEIDGYIDELKRIADGMYSPNEFGIEPYRMYSLVKKVDLNDPKEFERYTLLKENISQSLMAIRYPDLQRTYERFKDRGVITNLKAYYQCLDTAPWIALMKRDLTDYDVGCMKRDLLELEKETKEWQSKGFLSRMFGKGQVNRTATTILDRYFVNYNAKNIDQFISQTENTMDSLDMYPEYAMKLSAYERMSRLERAYGENLIAVNTRLPGTYDMSNDELFAFIMMDHLKRFEADNRMLLQDINNFENIRRNVDDLISKKMEMTRDKTEFVLRDHLTAITDSKMSGEIRRIAESKRRWSVNKFLNKFGSDMFRGVKVWLMTPDVVSELLPLEMGLFDLLIFDEASQMYVEKGIPSIYRAKKVVVAGDHKQLRPSSLGTGRMTFDDDDIDEEEYVSAALDEDSLLDLARARYDSILLNFHYRSRYEELIAFSNYAFYGGRLYVSPNIDIPKVPPIETHLIKGAKWEDKANRKEAKAVVELLKDIFANRKKKETIGVITFNISQRNLIEDLLDEEGRKDKAFGDAVAKEMERKDNGEDVGLFLKNIESVQGDERDIIVFSVGYAKNESGRIAQRFGWLNNQGGENRLNVAISRARRKIHIVTSFLPEELDVSGTKNDGPKYLKKYLEYAFAVSEKDSAKERMILESFVGQVERETNPESVFDDQICEALKERGFNAEKNVGIGGYSIDVAVKERGRYILGIECDNSLYDGAKSTRERDYHRQKYLESRGWNLYRVWSNHWWNNPEAEMEKIVTEIMTIKNKAKS